MSALNPAVFRFVAHLATVVAFAFKFGIATLFPVTVQPSIIDPTGWAIDAVHCGDERRLLGDEFFQLHAWPNFIRNDIVDHHALDLRRLPLE